MNHVQLVSAGLHRENGLDPEISLRLYQIYVLPVLLYGMEVVFSRQKSVEVLDKSKKHYIKHLLSLPVTTADRAMYILSGTLPVEAMAHQRVLTFFENISRLPESSVEKQLAKQQLAVRSLDSNSWFICVKKLCIMYGLPDCREILEKTQSKNSRKATVGKAINCYWSERLYRLWLLCIRVLNG